MADTRQELDEILADMNKVMDKHDDTHFRLARLKREVEAVMKENADLKRISMVEHYKAESKKHLEELQKLSVAAYKLSDEKQKLSDEKKKLLDENKKLLKEVSKARSERNFLFDQNKERDERYKELEAEHEHLEKSYLNLRTAFRDADDQNDLLEGRIQDYERYGCVRRLTDDDDENVDRHVKKRLKTESPGPSVQRRRWGTLTATEYDREQTCHPED